MRTHLTMLCFDDSIHVSTDPPKATVSS
jgi:hypothetical protein